MRSFRAVGVVFQQDCGFRCDFNGIFQYFFIIIINNNLPKLCNYDKQELSVLKTEKYLLQEKDLHYNPVFTLAATQHNIVAKSNDVSITVADFWQRGCLGKSKRQILYIYTPGKKPKMAKYEAFNGHNHKSFIKQLARLQQIHCNGSFTLLQ